MRNALFLWLCHPQPMVRSLRHTGGMALCGLLAFILCLTSPHAQAGDLPSLDLENNQWMSFDHYNDITQRKAQKAAASEASAPQEKLAAEITSQAPAPNNESPSHADTVAVAPPQRKIDLPVMPGISKNFSLPITSTVDETSNVPMMDEKIQPDIYLSEQNWEAPSNHTANEDRNEEDSPPKVRLSFPPNAKVTPSPSPDSVSVMKLDHAIVRQREAEAAARRVKGEDKKTPAVQAACAAIDAYKKQQLQAIQGDRETLKALQDAIASLGLQKQLGFISDNRGSLNASAPQTGGMDMPASTTVR